MNFRIAATFTFVLAIFSFLLSASTSNQCHAQTPQRLTNYTGHDLYPSWDPRGSIIAYVRNKVVGGNIYDAYRVLSSAQGGETPLLTGLDTDFGVAVSTSWIGNSGFVSFEEAISGFEVLRFDPLLAPFSRTVTNGSDSANQVLLSINGGGGGGLLKYSRDGSTALIRISSRGSVGTISVRVGPVNSMTGQVSSTFGTPILSASSGSDATYTKGGALTPDGKTAVIASPLTLTSGPHDLIAITVGNPNSTFNITNSAASGISNMTPDISPDGKTIVFARSSNGATGPFDLYTIGLDGTGLTQITDTPNFSETDPSWSADGTALTYMGIHTIGHETESPALNPGETANYNVYLLTLTPANTVTPGTKLLEPPLIAINNRAVTFTLTPFKKADKKTSASLLAEEFLLAAHSRAGAKYSFKYELIVKGTGAGKKNSFTKLSTRNVVTYKNVPPGSYTSKFRVKIFKKSGGKFIPSGKTKFSPSAQFTVL